MSQAEAVPAAEPKKEKKPMSVEERRQKRSDLQQLLVIVLIIVLIAYFGLSFGISVLSLGLWFAAKFFTGAG